MTAASATRTTIPSASPLPLDVSGWHPGTAGLQASASSETSTRLWCQADVALLSFLEGFAVTLTVEAPIYTLVLSRVAKVSAGRALMAAVIVNALSYPLFALVLVPALDRAATAVTSLILAEAVVCLLEAALLAAWLRRWIAAIIAATLIANGCSFLAGTLLSAL